MPYKHRRKRRQRGTKYTSLTREAQDINKALFSASVGIVTVSVAATAAARIKNAA